MTVTIPSMLPTGLRRILPAAIFAATVAVTITTAPAAHARSEEEIQADCAATGGTYTTFVADDGTRHSSCCIKFAGVVHCDIYRNGELTYSGQNYPDPAPPSSRPLPPGPVPSQILVPGNPPPANNPG